jgi:hypothetical protein
MSLTVRRVVTGHDANGNARVVIDEIAKNVLPPAGCQCGRDLDERELPGDNDGNATLRAGRSALRSTTAWCSAW